jgi:single-stranded-DNA-specific exonuclease
LRRANCVRLTGKTRLLSKLGLAALPHTKHQGLQELLRASCGDPDSPDAEDVAFRIAPRINAAGRVAHPYAALEVMAAGSDVEKARAAVAHLNHLNAVRRELVHHHFEELREELAGSRPAALVLYRERAPKGIAGLLAAKCVEEFGVPSIVLVPSGTPGVAVGSGRSVRGFDLEKEMQNFASLFDRFGGHPQAVGLTLPVSRITELRRCLEESCRGLSRSAEIQAEADLSFASLSPAFYSAVRQLEPFGEGNPAPVFRVQGAEVTAVKNRWVRLRQGRHSLELFNWHVKVESGMRGDCLVEFRSKTRNLLGFSAK